MRPEKDHRNFIERIPLSALAFVNLVLTVLVAIKIFWPCVHF
jgi:hypothetical protein